MPANTSKATHLLSICGCVNRNVRDKLDTINLLFINFRGAVSHIFFSRARRNFLKLFIIWSCVLLLCCFMEVFIYCGCSMLSM